MRRRLAIWMYQRALKLEPLIAIGIQQAADELACARLQHAIAEAQQAEAHQAQLERHRIHVQRVAQNN